MKKLFTCSKGLSLEIDTTGMDANSFEELISKWVRKEQWGILLLSDLEFWSGGSVDVSVDLDWFTISGDNGSITFMETNAIKLN